MKKLLIYVAVLSMVCTGAAQAVPIAVENYSFELPGTVKQSCWDGEKTYDGCEDVPNWTDGDSDAMDSGVEETLLSGWIGVTGDWRAYLQPADGPIWNLTTYEIATGDVFNLKVDAGATGSSGRGIIMELYYDDGTQQHTLGTTAYTFPVNKTLSEYTLADVAATEASEGHPIGIRFAASGYYIALDNVRLDVIPEPATMALLGLGSLALLKRRRA